MLKLRSEETKTVSVATLDMAMDGGAINRLNFHNTCGWRPNKDIIDLLQRVGEDSQPRTKLAVLAINEWNEILRY